MFGSTISNRPVTISQQLTPQNHAITFNNVPVKPIYHLSVFMLPNVPFDPEYTALVYYQVQTNRSDNNQPSMELASPNEFKLLGFLNQEKQSSIFKLNPGKLITTSQQNTHQEGDIDMDMDIDLSSAAVESVNVIIGITIEPNENALRQLESMRLSQQIMNRDSASASVRASASATPSPIKFEQQELLAVSNKIIGNAYNFLSSFADAYNRVDLGKFNDWWSKFKVKMANEPDYLEKME